MSGLKVVLGSIAIMAVFIVPHFVAGIYAVPKAPTEECAKPYSPPGSRASLAFPLPG